MGTGDWNDGMNKVGARGKGESAWMAFFLYHVAGQFKPLAQARDEARFEQECEKMAEAPEQRIDQHAWDGAWFLRATFADRSPLGAWPTAYCTHHAVRHNW